MAEAERFGVSGTPTFFVNSQVVKGAASFTAVKREIDQALTLPQTHPRPQVVLTSPAPPVLPTSASEEVNTKRGCERVDSGRVISAPRLNPSTNLSSQSGKAQQQASAMTTATGVTLSPGTINFGYQLVGTTSLKMVETVTNSGTQPLVVTDISISGRDRSDFILAYSFTLPVTVAPGNSIAINLTFTPALPWRAGPDETMYGYSDWIHGPCAATSECRINQIRLWIFNNVDSTTDPHEPCVQSRCQSLWFPFQFTQWAKAD